MKFSNLIPLMDVSSINNMLYFVVVWFSGILFVVLMLTIDVFLDNEPSQMLFSKKQP